MSTPGRRSRSHAGRCLARPLLAAFGWFNVALGVIGMIVPGMPTTVFLLIALWAFSKSSERFRIWLYEHPRLERPLRDWHEHRVIPRRAKALAVGSMKASLLFLALVVAEDWMLPAIVAATMAPVALFILTRPSRPLA
ncbi:MAG: DUF454 domain-containing protein [Alphaproteobacteria bacterium]|nr:DUF454 domain-containing protein [Alphaproteobacteria bacterium]